MIPYEDLLGFVNAPENEPGHAVQIEGHNENHLQVGMVQIPEITIDPEFFQRFQSSPLPKPSSKAIRLWVQYFSSNNSSSPIIMPDNLLAFFIFLLQSPTFSCARDFL